MDKLYRPAPTSYHAEHYEHCPGTSLRTKFTTAILGPVTD